MDELKKNLELLTEVILLENQLEEELESE